MFRGEGAPAIAREAAGRVNRYARRVLVSAGGEFEEAGASGLAGEREVALAFSLEKGGLPLVHGYMREGAGGAEGECSLLGMGEAGYYGARDPLGTRGLWVIRQGRGAGSISSDYRLLGGRGELIPPGAAYEKGMVRVTARHVDAKRAPKFDQAAKELAAILDGVVEERVRGHRRVAVSFSGGRDSSLLALLASRHTDVVLCSAYAPGSRDEGQSEKAASLLGLELKTVVLDAKTVAKRSEAAELPPGEATLMDKALWCIYTATSELAKRNKARMIILGQLADELFGGYMKYAKAAAQGAGAAERMMAEDVKACADRGFLRDEAACSASCEARFPYADSRVASFAALLPLDYKIRGGERKAVLRAAALELGLPEQLAAAPKKAAQFSSGAAKLLKGL